MDEKRRLAIFGPRPPAPSGPFLPEEIDALRRVVDSIDYSFGTLKTGPDLDRDRQYRAFVRHKEFDFFERHYLPLFVFARHGLSKKEAVTVPWSGWKGDRLHLPDGRSFVLLDKQGVEDLTRLRDWYPSKGSRAHYLTGARIYVWNIDRRIMERWADRANLRRAPILYDHLRQGFFDLEPARFTRFSLP